MLDYTDALEETQPDEEALTRQILASMARVNRQVFDKHRHALRDAHAKSHGILHGELEVYPGLPPHLSQGIFAAASRYSVIARLSTAPGDLQSDRLPSPRGMAIKILGVQGRKVLPEDQSRNQDFLLVNNPTIPFGNVSAYWTFQQSLEKLLTNPQRTDPKPASEANFNLLGETFHSMGALRFGSYVAKVSVAPMSAGVKSLTGTPLPDGDSILRDVIVAFFHKHSAAYELRAQLLTDLARMPIEDDSVEWPETLSPHQPLGMLTFPQQDAYSPARRVYGDDVLSFSPWRCIEEHRPLGSIMRIRRTAYGESSAFRHQMNVQKQLEPADITELPA